MDTLAQPWAFMALAACAIVGFGIVRMRHRASASTIVWALPFAAAALFFAVWCARGLCQIAPGTFCLDQAIIVALGLAVLQRQRPARALEQLIGSSESKRRTLACALSWIRDIALIVLASLLSFLAMEIADNPDWMLIDRPLFLRGLELVGLAIACLYFLGQRRGALCVVVPFVCAIFGLVQNFLNLFKNTALLPSDVMAWKTAAAVSGGYAYTLPTLAIACIVCALGAIGALSFIVPIRPAEPRPMRTRTMRAVACVIAGTLCACAIWFGTTVPDYQDDLGVKLDYWDLRTAYHENGFLVSFIAAAQDLAIDKPAGYSDESANKLQDELARLYDEQLAGDHEKERKRFSSIQPNVIAIMNESYSDLSIYEQLHDGYEGTYVTRELSDAPVTGWLNMSVLGGGTCNSEYEFLALSSMAFIGSGMYPYQQFSFTNTDTLPSVFKQLGYDTWAMHPSFPGNWSREFVYATMSIDTSLFVYDFWEAEKFHGFVSDRATYDKALEIVRNADKPQFVLDVTMQNHSGYDTGSIPPDKLTDIRPDFLSDAATSTLNEFLSCISASDEALEYLIDELRKTDKPVAVVFFGDHQPGLSRDLNDALFPDEDELAHKARLTIVPYFIWTNYDTEPESRHTVESSASYLGAQLLETIGAPLSPYQKALLYLHQKIPAVNTNGFCDESGTWHDASEGAADGHPYHQLQILHYLNVVRNL